MKDASPSDPRDTHAKALSERKQSVAELDQRANAIANLRLVALFAAIALIGGIVFARLPSIAWLGELALVVAFGALVVIHARVHQRLDRMNAAVQFHERALARMEGKWRAFPQTGERWADAMHPYGGDLDVFGRASLFQLIDATSTRFGEEVLAKWLSGDEARSKDPAEAKSAIIVRQAAVRDLAARVRVREELCVAGSLVDEGKPDPRPFVMWAGQAASGENRLPGWMRIVAIVMPIVTIGTAMAGSVGLVPRLTFVASFIVSLLFLGWQRKRLQPILEAASSKEGALSRYAGMLAILENEAFEAEALVALQKRLKESGASATREMASLSRIVGFLDARENEIFKIFIGPTLMWDVWCALALDAWRARAGRVAFGWFRALAELEALSSLAGFAFEKPDFSFPEFVDEPILEAELLGHPLIESGKRVSNDVALPGPGHAMVVTGSNMSGKSTLLRAIGINAVLANVGAPVCAKSMRLGRLRVATSMRVSDSLEEGTSRFYAELKKLKLVLDLARTEKAGGEGAKGATLLFLLDEILHGTNTRERLIGARAILRELLALGAMGAVSTHDLALGDLETEMPGFVKNVHFEEQVEGEVMTFDYRLRQGVVQSSNALRLMKIVGLEVT